MIYKVLEQCQITGKYRVRKYDSIEFKELCHHVSHQVSSYSRTLRMMKKDHPNYFDVKRTLTLWKNWELQVYLSQNHKLN